VEKCSLDDALKIEISNLTRRLRILEVKLHESPLNFDVIVRQVNNSVTVPRTYVLSADTFWTHNLSKELYGKSTRKLPKKEVLDAMTQFEKKVEIISISYVG
jgi:hypothetical protein